MSQEDTQAFELPPCPFDPTHDYVVGVRLKSKSQQSNLIVAAGGDSADERYDVYVVGVGPGVQTEAVDKEGNPILRKPTVKRGDKIIFNPPSCQHFDLFGYKFIICPNLHVFGPVNEEAHAWLKAHEIKPPLLTTAQAFVDKTKGPPKNGPHRRN